MPNSLDNGTKIFGYSTKDITDVILSTGTKIAIAAAILIIGLWITKRVVKRINKTLEKRDMDESLRSFLSSLTSIGLKIMIVITAIGQLGIEMTSFVAILGAAGLAIGMAFSGTLSNFAGGVMLLVFKPYKVGDLVNIQGEEGVVEAIHIFNTILTTPDNRKIIVANGPASSGNITNYTKDSDIRTVNWTFGIAYGDNLQVAKQTLGRYFQEDERILKDQEQFVGLAELADSSVNLACRVWVKNDDYWGVYFDIQERVYNEFEEAGLSIPFPQMDVHLDKVEA